MVKDPETEKSRGSAFIHFEDKAAADTALTEGYKFLGFQDIEECELTTGNFLIVQVSAMPPTESGIFLDGKAVILARAVDKKTAVKMETEKRDKFEKKDKRNLYLAAEGCRENPFSDQLKWLHAILLQQKESQNLTCRSERELKRKRGKS